MQETKRTFPRGCVVGLALAAVSILLMFSTVGYVHHPAASSGWAEAGYTNDLLECAGRVGVGLPLPFLCDYSSGGSPGPESWGRIDPSDFPYFSPLGTALDFLFYFGQLGLLCMIVTSIQDKGPEQAKRTRWVMWIGLAYVVGCFSAMMLTQFMRFRFEETHPRTPTPTFFTPTPFGTPPPPEFTPLPTQQVP